MDKLSTISNSWDAIIFVGLLGAVLLYRWLQKRSSNAMEDGPLLAAEGMLGVSGLTGLNQGAIAGFHYAIMTNDAGSVMISVDLAHNTDMHLLAYGDKSKLSPVVTSTVSKKWLEPVSLEGDFPDYFHLYVSPDKQLEVRQVFAPDTMARFADFCRAYDFEIFHEALYISQNDGARDAGDETTLVTDITEFLQQNAGMLRQL